MIINNNTAYHPTEDGGYRLDVSGNEVTLSILEREKITKYYAIPASHATITLGGDCMKDLQKDLKYFLDKLFPEV